jgi:hypothetical protein
MYYKVATTMIASGTILALAPTASDFIQGWQMAEAISGQAVADPSGFFRQPLEESYRVGAWILGSAMIGLGITRGW